MRVLALLLPLFLAAWPAHARNGSAIPTRFAVALDVPPRQQWNGNWGYCGETSLISAGMALGQYASQFTVRAIASPGVPQSEERSQLLLGVNDVAAARRMRLTVEPFSSDTQGSTGGFLRWVKSHLVRGHLVAIGLFNNVRLLEEASSGDGVYDHIVPVLGFGSARPLDDPRAAAHPDDVITFSDNGLYGPVGNPPVRPMLYSYRLRTLPKTRREANRRDGTVYALRRKLPNYGLAVTGIADLDGDTIPVRLTADLDAEPAIVDGSNVAPAPVPLVLTAHVTIPDPTVGYVVYRYDDFAQVPDSQFNAAAGRAVAATVVPPGAGPTVTLTLPTTTDATVVLRAVRQSAP